MSIGKPGPFQIIESECGFPEAPMDPPRRRYDCSNYETCLDLAAALNWDSFTCRGCCGQVNESFFWRAHQAKKRDGFVRMLCSLPEIQYIDSAQQENSGPQENGPLKVVVKG